MSSKMHFALDQQKDDRISWLPDDILCQILSYLPSVEAVRAGVLSTRWKNLWGSLVNLDIDYNFKLRIHHKKNRKQKELEKSYYNVVMNMIERGKILKLRLCSSHWARSGLKDIELNIHRDHMVLAQKLFMSTSLEELILETEILALPASVGLPNLKTLHLNVSKYRNDWDLDVLMSGCPAIEEFVIKRRAAEEKKVVFDISRPTLKRLHMEFVEEGNLGRREHYAIQPYKLVINAPNLEYLHLKDYHTKSFLVTDMGSLVEAYVDWQPMYGGIMSEYFSSSNSSHVQIFELLKGITAVKSLSLSGHSIHSLNNAVDSDIPTFNNLKNLKLDVAGDSGCQFLARFLPSAPNLEVLTLICKDVVEDVFEEDWTPPDHVPDCVQFHLKEIKVKGLKDFFEFEAVEYLLKHSQVLNKLTVEYDAGTEQQAQAQAFFDKLTWVPRGSPSCEVTIMHGI